MERDVLLAGSWECYWLSVRIWLQTFSILLRLSDIILLPICWSISIPLTLSKWTQQIELVLHLQNYSAWRRSCLNCNNCEYYTCKLSYFTVIELVSKLVFTNSWGKYLTQAAKCAIVFSSWSLNLFVYAVACGAGQAVYSDKLRARKPKQWAKRGFNLHKAVRNCRFQC